MLSRGHLHLTIKQFLAILLGDWTYEICMLFLWYKPLLTGENQKISCYFFPEVVLSDSCWKVTILTFLSGSIRSIGIFYCALAVGRWRQDFEPEVVRHILQAASKSLNVLEC